MASSRTIVFVLCLASFLARSTQSAIQLITPHKEYHYHVSASVQSSNISAEIQSTGDFSVSGLVIVKNVAQTMESDLISLQLSKIVVETHKKAIPYAKSSTGQIFIERDSESGIVKNIYKGPDKTSNFAKNLLKGIASLIQFNSKEGNRTETDISGECQAKYQVKGSEIAKEKYDCLDDQISKSKDDPLSIDFQPQRKVIYKLSKDSSELKSVTSDEIFEVSIIGNPNVGSRILSTISLQLESTKPLKSSSETPEKILKDSKATLTDWSGIKYPKCHLDSCVSLSDFITFKKDEFSKSGLGGQQLALSIIATILDINPVSSKDVVKILSSKKIKSIKGQILDVLAGIQSWDVYTAVMEVLDITKEASFLDLERYLQALMVVPNPEIKIIEDLLIKLRADSFKNPKLSSTLIQTVSSLCRTSYSAKTTCEKCDALGKMLWDKFEAAKEMSEKAIILRGFINLRCPNEIQRLLSVVEDESKALGSVAMQALIKLENSNFDSKLRKKLMKIALQLTKKFDSSIRTMAIEIILNRSVSNEEIHQLLNLLKTDRKSFEVNQYLLERLKSKTESCAKFRDQLSGIIETDPSLNNYHVLATGGLSTILSRQFTKNPSLNSSILSIQEIEKGVLKRGIVDLLYHSESKQVSYFTLELYTKGLASLAGSKDSEDQEDADIPTAGMEISMNGNLMRQLEFFSGQGDLMGHVWSGTASDPTPAYQATTILRDQRHGFMLQSGFVFDIKFLVAISLDLNGQIVVSLWNRNAKSNVEQNVGLAVVGRAALQADFGASQAEFRLLQEPQLSLKSHIEFSGNNLLCLELNQPDSLVIQSLTKTISVPSLKLSKEKKSELKFIIPGNSHLLNRKNNEMCNLIHNP